MPLDVEKIRRIREKLGITQEQAAAAAGLKGGRQAWNDIESGRRVNLTIETLERIAGALGTRAAELLH